MPTVLFVCTGNICRSPMAAVLFKDRLSRDPAREGWRVLSGGVWTEDGHAASAGAVMAMADRGLDLSDHRSTRVDEALVREADLILGMTLNHVEALRQSFPQAAEKVYLLTEMAGESYSVADPYGLSEDEYRATAQELSRLVEDGYEQIVLRCERRWSAEADAC